MRYRIDFYFAENNFYCHS